MPLQCSTESAIHDLYTWLKTEPELDVQSIKHSILISCLQNVSNLIYNLLEIYVLLIL